MCLQGKYLQITMFCGYDFTQHKKKTLHDCEKWSIFTWFIYCLLWVTVQLLESNTINSLTQTQLKYNTSVMHHTGGQHYTYLPVYWVQLAETNSLILIDIKGV